jgi:Ca2+-binding EF-hand superfamily protein
VLFKFVENLKLQEISAEDAFSYIENPKGSLAGDYKGLYSFIDNSLVISSLGVGWSNREKFCLASGFDVGREKVLKKEFFVKKCNNALVIVNRPDFKSSQAQKRWRKEQFYNYNHDGQGAGSKLSFMVGANGNSGNATEPPDFVAILAKMEQHVQIPEFMNEILDHCRIENDELNLTDLNTYIKKFYTDRKIITAEEQRAFLTQIDYDKNSKLDIYEFRDFFLSKCQDPDEAVKFTLKLIAKKIDAKGTSTSNYISTEYGVDLTRRYCLSEFVVILKKILRCNEATISNIWRQIDTKQEGSVTLAKFVQAINSYRKTSIADPLAKLIPQDNVESSNKPNKTLKILNSKVDDGQNPDQAATGKPSLSQSNLPKEALTMGDLMVKLEEGNPNCSLNGFFVKIIQKNENGGSNGISMRTVKLVLSEEYSDTLSGSEQALFCKLLDQDGNGTLDFSEMIDVLKKSVTDPDDVARLYLSTFAIILDFNEVATSDAFNSVEIFPSLDYEQKTFGLKLESAFNCLPKDALAIFHYSTPLNTVKGAKFFSKIDEFRSLSPSPKKTPPTFPEEAPSWRDSQITKDITINKIKSELQKKNFEPFNFYIQILTKTRTDVLTQTIPIVDLKNSLEQVISDKAKEKLILDFLEIMDTDCNGLIDKDEYDILFMDSKRSLAKMSEAKKYLQVQEDPQYKAKPVKNKEGLVLNNAPLDTQIVKDAH